MTSTTTYTRLQLAKIFIDRVPDPNLKLDVWADLETVVIGDGYDATPKCNTIACAAGWLGMSPAFKKLGFSLMYVNDVLIPVFNDNVGSRLPMNYMALAILFDISSHTAEMLFEPVTPKERSERDTTWISDKQIWMNRVDRYLVANFDLDGNPK